MWAGFPLLFYRSPAARIPAWSSPDDETGQQCPSDVFTRVHKHLITTFVEYEADFAFRVSLTRRLGVLLDISGQRLLATTNSPAATTSIAACTSCCGTLT